MSKKVEEKVIETEEIEVVETEVIEDAESCEEKSVGKGKKIFAGVKKHGKRIIVGTLAIIGGVTVVGKIISGSKTEDVEVTEEDVDDVEVTEF